MGSEQSNTSVVLGDRLVLKLYRRLEAGVNPELELLRFLTERGFPAIAALEGWAVHVGQPLDATLAILQDYVPVRSDGWRLALDDLAGGSSGNGFVPLVRRLGEVTGEMHSVLASDPSDPVFCPEEASAEALALIVARVDEEIQQVFSSLPDDPRVSPLAGRGDELRDRLQAIGQGEPLGRLIRHHGDYHLGQVIWTERDDWVVLDFEGEPARPLHERRHKRSPLRDVAGMLRSFSYASSASSLERGIEPPIGWEGRVREEFLAGYLDSVDPMIVPGGLALERRLRLFELEKALYELHYELGHRPDWVRVPVAGILQLLEEPL
jgi:trehalose synthase-fused probable maltokinase